MAEAQGIRMKNPVHPGGFVKSEVIEPLELSVTGAARALGVTRAALSAVLNERARLSPEMALRLARYAYVLETGTVALEGPAAHLHENAHVRRAYLGG